MSNGLPIVFVHGVRVSGACWVDQATLLAPDHPVAAPDLPGHGARRGQRFTLSGAVAAVLAAIDSIAGKDGRALVIGHSLGGYVAIRTAAGHHDRVAGLMPVGCTLVPGRGLAAPWRVADRVFSLLPDRGEALNARILRAVLPSEVAGSTITAGLATEILPDVLSALAALDPINELARYPGPTTLVNGQYDHFRLQERQFLGACRRGTLMVVPGAGHLLPLGRTESFARLVRGEVERIISPSPRDAGRDPS